MASKYNSIVLRFVSGFITVLAIGAIIVLLVAPASLAQNPSSGSSLFLPAVTYPTGGFAIVSVAVADVNGDGNVDLIALSDAGTPIPPCPSCGGTVSVLLGNGDGTFQAAKTYGSGGLFASSVVVADIDGDGKGDILVGNTRKSPDEEYIGSVGVLLGNGDGTFQPATVYDSVWGTALVGIADLNGDGKPDLVVTACGSDCGWPGQGGVGVWLGAGDGTFQPTTTYTSGGQEPYRGAIYDVNGDGKSDLVVLNHSGNIGILLGNGDGSFQTTLSYAVGGFLTGVAAADLDRDGRLDLIVTSLCENGSACGPGKVQVLLGNGDGTFQMGATYLSTTNSYWSVAVADVDGDGKADVLAAGYSLPSGTAGVVDVLLGNGDGTFRPAITISSGSDRQANSVIVADVNGDGKLDLVVGNDWFDCNYCGLAVLLNNSPSCTTAPTVTISISPTTLWPPNGKMVPVILSGNITDAANCTVTSASYAVTDEYGEVQPRGSINLGANGAYSFMVPLEASRLGSDSDGRHYFVNVSASNSAKRTASQTRTVIVPHDQRQ